MNGKDENNLQHETMCENLRLLRERGNRSLAELSAISGISETILADIENGKDFGLEYLFILCSLYRIRLHEIFLPFA